MLALLLAAAALTPVTYGLEPGVKANYKADVVYDGFIPIMGGQDGKVEVNMDFVVTGLAVDDSKNPRASEELVGINIVFNSSKLPVGLEHVKDFFPKTVVSMTPQGKIVKNDAPDVDLPFKLPGLHIKRIPDVTYLPIEFPVEGIEVGKEFKFKKSFGDSDVQYAVTPTAVTEERIELSVKMSQTYDVWEDTGGEIVKDGKDAARHVTTTLAGGGKIMFDRKRKLIEAINISADANSTVVEVESQKKTERKLKTSLVVKLQKG